MSKTGEEDSNEEPVNDEKWETRMRKLIKKLSQVYVASDPRFQVLHTFNEPPTCHEISYHQNKIRESVRGKILQSSCLSAFTRKSIFGLKSGTFPINLTTEKCNLLVLTYQNLISLYEYGLRKDEFIYGHRNKIISSAVDSSGKWLVTSDVGEESLIVIWSIPQRFPFHVIKNYNKTGSPYVKLSPCGQLLLTIAEKENNTGKKLVALWEWTSKKDTPDVAIEIDETEYGKIQDVSFHHDKCDFIMLTTQKRAIFFTLKSNKSQLCITCENEITKDILSNEKPTEKCKCEKNNTKTKMSITYHNPKNMRLMKDCGTFNDSAYVRGTTMAVTATSRGHIVLWSELGLSNVFDKPEVLNNNKNFVRSLELDSQSINLIYNVERYIVTVNCKGNIIFYDNNLIVAYKIADVGHGIPVNISFNLSPKSSKIFWDEDFLRTDSGSYKAFDKKKLLEDGFYNHTLLDGRVRINEWKDDIRPVQCISDPKQIFNIRDFIVTTDRGNSYYINLNHVDIYEIKVSCFNEPTVIDGHPKENWVTIGNRNGLLILFDYVSISVLKTLDIFFYTEESDSKISKKDWNHMGRSITCLKYSSDGRYLGCGTGLGLVFLLDGSNLQMLFKIDKSNSVILKVLFSLPYFSFFDENGDIFLYHLSPEPSLIGNARPHFMPMTDATFFAPLGATCLYTIGEDGYLIGYNVEECECSNALVTKLSFCFEEIAKPCHLEMCSYLTSVLIVFNDKMESRFICTQTNQVICTVKGPSCGPVSNTEYFKLPFCAEELILFTASNNIGLIKLPFDGNPFRVISHRVGSNKVLSACLCLDRQQAFSVSEAEGLVLWQIDIKVLTQMENLGGEGVNPYLKAIKLSPNGPNLDDIHLMFEVVREMFIKNHNVDDCGKINEIPVNEVPNFMRALGAFPSNEELNFLWIECLGDPSKERRSEEIQFEHCLRLYSNYKDQLSCSVEEIQTSFVRICEEFNGCSFSEKPWLTKEDFLSLLRNEGSYCSETLVLPCCERIKYNFRSSEALASDLCLSGILSLTPLSCFEMPAFQGFSQTEIQQFLKELLRDHIEASGFQGNSSNGECWTDSFDQVCNYLPNTMNYYYFMTVLLGLSSHQLPNMLEEKAE